MAPLDRHRTRQLGRLLRAERERAHRALSELAAETRVPIESLERLETGDLTGLPAVVARGFALTYARSLGLPASVVERALPPSKVIRTPPSTAVVRPPARRRLSGGWAAAVLLALVLLTLVFALAFVSWRMTRAAPSDPAPVTAEAFAPHAPWRRDDLQS